MLATFVTGTASVQSRNYVAPADTSFLLSPDIGSPSLRAAFVANSAAFLHLWARGLVALRAWFCFGSSGKRFCLDALCRGLPCCAMANCKSPNTNKFAVAFSLEQTSIHAVEACIRLESSVAALGESLREATGRGELKQGIRIATIWLAHLHKFDQKLLDEPIVTVEFKYLPGSDTYLAAVDSKDLRNWSSNHCDYSSYAVMRCTVAD